MFDQFLDLPLHVLVLHFAVVLIPVCGVFTALVFLKPSLRTRPVSVPMIGRPPLTLPMVALATALNVAMLVLTFVTVRAGYALQEKLDPSKENVPNNDHEKYGELLLWIVLALTIVSILTVLVTRIDSFAPTARTGLAVVVAALAAASIVLTVVTGHTGSQSHWGFLYESK
ncbi:MAG: hypothetical protein ACT4PP_01280 [Sporichthyaceae bacterium]